MSQYRHPANTTRLSQLSSFTGWGLCLNKEVAIQHWGTKPLCKQYRHLLGSPPVAAAAGRGYRRCVCGICGVCGVCGIRCDPWFAGFLLRGNGQNAGQIAGLLKTCFVATVGSVISQNVWIVDKSWCNGKSVSKWWLVRVPPTLPKTRVKIIQKCPVNSG